MMLLEHEKLNKGTFSARTNKWKVELASFPVLLTSFLIRWPGLFMMGREQALCYDLIQMIVLSSPSRPLYFFLFLFQKLWWLHVWPTLQAEMKTQEVLASALQPIFLLISQVSEK